MEEEGNNKRLLLAAGLSMLVLLGWTLIFPQKRPEPKPHGSAGDGTVTSTAVVEAKTSTKAAVAAGPPTEKIPPELFEFEGAVPGADGERIPYKIALTNVGGGIELFSLPSYRERDADNRATEDPIQLANGILGASEDVRAMLQMAGIGFSEASSFRLPRDAVFEVVEKSATRVVYRYRTAEGVEVEREYSFQADSFQVELAVTVRNASGREQRHQLETGMARSLSEAMEQGSGFLAKMVPPPDHLNALCYADGDVEREAQTALAGKDEPVRHEKGARWVAMDRQYFVAALISRDGADAGCRLEAKGRIGRATLVLPEVVLRAGEEKRHKFTAYLGIKKPAYLTLADANLEAAIDYNILGLNLAPVCTALLWILGLIHGWTGSWGVAILGLTILVKAVLFPLNQRSGRSMRAMSALKPEMEAIRAKFPDDKQRQNEEMLKLWRTHNVNPAGGCLPILIQMPIWFALYRSLWVAVDLYQEGFLWIPDLTARDPTWVLPILLIVVMFVQQKMTPSTMDPAQQKVMLYTMPLMFGAMMVALPAGLAFYILVNTLLTIAQQHFINKSIGPIGGSTSVQGAAA